MKKLLAVGSLAVLLGGCASNEVQPTSYEPLGDYGGYSETKVNKDVYEVRGTVNYRTLPEYSDKYAMVRSAEIACKNGYDYFSILDKRIHSTGPTTSYLTIQMEKENKAGVYDVKVLLKDMVKQHPSLAEKLSCPLN